MITLLFIATMLGARLVLLLDDAQKKHLKEVDEALYDYCLHRGLVICPRCRTPFKVSSLEEQFNLDWECACCGTRFVEHPTHTQIKE